jgi:hypothetical protein
MDDEARARLPWRSLFALAAATAAALAAACAAPAVLATPAGALSRATVGPSVADHAAMTRSTTVRGKIEHESSSTSLALLAVDNRHWVVEVHSGTRITEDGVTISPSDLEVGEEITATGTTSAPVADGSTSDLVISASTIAVDGRVYANPASGRR